MTRLFWEIGTAFDLFVSLHILHNPAEHGLRKSWARGVRARLAPDHRALLEVFTSFRPVPIYYLAQLPAPKDSTIVLDDIAATAPELRLARIFDTPFMPEELLPLLEDVGQRGAWGPEELARFLELDSRRPGRRPRRKQVEPILDLWADVAGTGERLLAAFREYHEVFFAEEEQRIRPVLEQALEDARTLAGRLPLSELLEELSQGVRYMEPLGYDELQLVPSFWSTPFIISAQVSEKRRMMLFGARPADMSLVPGEVVPDALYQTLKALADPTRLRILRYLTAESLTPAELSRRLRLRPPTVSHHLYTLRLARLVHFTIEKGDKRRYSLRQDAVDSTVAALGAFLNDE